MARLPLGTPILGRYVLMRAIGQGGVSTVYSAVDAHRGRRLAVKVLAPTMADDPGARDDVRREALITHRLRHPGVPRVFEYGDAPLPDGTVVPYVVLELLSGVPLTEKLAGGPLDWPEAVRIAASVADVLAVAHRRGVVHRDLTARNVMITANGVKIIDFGLATAALRDVNAVTGPLVIRSHQPRGVLPTHPKTQFAHPADDVYTLGVLLYEMLVGHSPYPRAVAATILASGRAGHLAPTPVLAVPGLAGEVRDLVRACMAKNPADRPASADVALALWSVLHHTGVRLLEPSYN
ncbi:serine/threonine-protein kinase [Jidongwangia harbinensis]|uniref:serine/threonine-protein kinase n=1 Tax=Jidongwangia harbinensis TaxID=2878561 RepID=UPI001CD95CCD|nr:serine/threonine-protein kinase [Jidongwangia harbinensis]MCA2218464.1 serine/threonine protein kinase [Jidongwangia harbinensis]